MTKRQKFVSTSIILALGFFGVQFVDFSYRYEAIAALSIFAGILSTWSLKDGLGRNATLLTLVLPILFTVGSELFYLGLENSGFFSGLPEYVRMLVRILLFIIFTVGVYALLLTANIYTVATARTIQLLRAAHAVGFLLTLFASFFMFNAILSFHTEFWLSGLSSFLISLPLFLQGFWSVELEEKVGKEVMFMALCLALIVGEIAVVLSFWPITVPVGSLALTTIVYVGLGLGQAKLQQRLFDKTIKEYLLVGVIVFITMFLTSRWGG